MNKHCYRTIFSRTLQQLIVVSELASNQSKSALGAHFKTAEKPTALGLPFDSESALSAVSFALFLALGMVYSQPSFADEMAIRADKSAPANQQATILATANGIPQVNIQTPTKGGVSRNTYSQFDVANQGAILNNARKHAKTELAGWVQGNPNLSAGEAKVILNEVNSSNPSRLQGYVEVAGKKADVVIANPSGIHCSGCGVINAGRATLTTGKAELENGALKGFVVEQGEVKVSGRGLDTSRVDYTDIIAKTAQIDAGIWAKELKITTGHNKVNASNDDVVYLGDQNNEKTDRTSGNDARQYAVDVSQLGGMYAGKIRLLDKDGIGVRNAGNIGATAGNVEIDAKGKIQNLGYIGATETTKLDSQDRIDNQGTLYAQQETQLKGKIINNKTGTIAAEKSVKIKADTLEHEGTIATHGDADVQLKTDFTLTQALQVANNLTFRSEGKLVNKVEQRVGNKLSVQAAAVNNAENAELSGKTTEISTALLTNRGLIDGKQTHLNATRLENLGTGRIYGDHLAIESQDLTNDKENDRSATIAARERLDLGVGKLINRDHSLILSLGQLSIGGKLGKNHHATGYATEIDNGSATIEALGNGVIKTQHLLNHDLHLKTGIDTQHEHIVEAAKGTSSERYRFGVDGDGLDWNRRSRKAWFSFYDGRPTQYQNDWYGWSYDRQTDTPIITEQDQGKILVGGDLSLEGGTFHNKYSQLLVGGTLSVGDKKVVSNPSADKEGQVSDGKTALFNEDLKGEIHVTDEGQSFMWVSYRSKWRKRYGHKRKHDAPYRFEHAPIDYAFNTVRNSVGDVAVVNAASSHAAISDQQANNGIALPTTSLYKVAPAADRHYLVETDSRFTNKKQWLSSDYMFNALRYDPQNMLKRLGDGYYEQRLVNEQINQLTGQRYLDGYNSDYEQYKALMDSGVYYAKKFNLSLGMALTAEQMAELTTDLVWFVEKSVILADGSHTKVLAPQVYIAPKNAKVTPAGALISANRIVMNSQRDIDNQGTISARNLTALSAQNIHNSGTISGERLALSAVENLNVLGGTLSAAKQLLAKAKNIHAESTTSSVKSADGNFAETALNKVAKFTVTGENSQMTLYANNNVTMKGANVSVTGESHIVADNQLELGAVNTSRREHYGSGDNHYYLDQTREQGNTFTLNGNATLVGKSAVEMRGNSLSSNGTVNMASQGDVRIAEARQTEQLDSAYKASDHGILSKTTRSVKHAHHTDLAIGSQIDGANVNVHSANGNVSVQGSDVVADNALTLKGKNVNITESANHIYEENVESRKKSGLMGSGGIGFSIGQRKETLSRDETEHYARGSQVGALNGKVTVNADDAYNQQASNVTSVNNDVNIHAQRANITSANNTYETNSKYVYEQKGLTIALTSPILDMMNGVISAVKSTKNIGASKDDRINALSAANSAWSAYRLYQNVGTIQNMASDLMKGNLGSDGAGGGVGVSITYGQQKNVSTTHTEGNTATASAVNAGGKVNITATGAGERSDINLIGSDVSGKQGTNLKADDDVNLLAAKQSHQERSKNKSSGFNAGVAIQFGNGMSFGITAGGNYGKGYGNGDETTYTYTHVGDANSQTHIESGVTTTIQGAQVQGKGVKLEAENLNIESLQETHTYKGKQMNVSGQVTVGYGFSASGSYNQSKMNADYASVVEQSGIYAGDDGYQVDVAKHTDLKGGLITSSQDAEEHNKNSFETGTLTYADIRNHADYSGSSFGIGGGFSMGGGEGPKEIGGMKLSEFGQNASVTTVNADGSRTQGIKGKMGSTLNVGMGHDSEHDSSATRSGINTKNINIRDDAGQVAQTGKSAETAIAEIKTDITTQSAVENSGKLEQNFDKEKVLKELNIQVEVTKEFRSNAFSTIDAYVLPKQAELRDKVKNAKTEDEKTALYDEIYKLQYQKRLLETVVGIISGTPELAITQGTLQLAATKMREETLANSRIFKGIYEKDKKTGKLVKRMDNVSHDSGYFDGVKLGGVRVDLDVICGVSNERCSITDDYKVIYNRNDNYPTVSDAINPKINPDAAKLYGETGGYQPESGVWNLHFMTIPYSVGSWSDRIIESFAGTHDYLGGQLPGWYDKCGNTSRNRNTTENIGATATTIIAIPVSAPFAVSDLISSDMLEVLFKLAGH